MDPEKALVILQALSDGVDPQNGENLPAQSPYQQPDVIRALYTAMQALRQTKRHSSRLIAGNAGKPWSKEEDESLIAGYDAGQSLDDLAKMHGRSRLGVQARLARFGKIQPPASLPSTRQAREWLAAYHA